MIAFLLNALIIMGVMWAFFRFMYPKPPTAFLPKKDDDVSLRVCDYCGHSLATYRGIYEKEGIEMNSPPPKDTAKTANNLPVPKAEGERFFCNDEHKAAFYQAVSGTVVDTDVADTEIR